MRRDHGGRTRGQCDGGAARLLGNHRFLDELAALVEHLDAVAGAIADIHHAVPGDLDAGHIAKRSRRRRGRIVGPGRRAGRLLAVREPVAFVRPAVGIEHDDAMVAAVGDEHLVRGRIVRHGRRTVERRLAVGAFHLAGRADGQQVSAVARKFQHVRVRRSGGRRRRRAAAAAAAPAGAAAPRAGAGSRAATGCPAATPSSAASAAAVAAVSAPATSGGRRRRFEPGGRNPDVALGVDGDAAGHLRPLISLARSTPARDQLSGGVELKNRRRRRAAHARARRRQDHPLFVALRDESAPRWATQTWFCASTATPVIEPSTHESSVKRLRPQRRHPIGGRRRGAAALARGAMEVTVMPTRAARSPRPVVPRQ